MINDELKDYLMLPREVETIGEVYPIRLREWDKFSKMSQLLFANSLQNVKNLYEFEGEYLLDFYVGKDSPAMFFKKTCDEVLEKQELMQPIELKMIKSKLQELKETIKLTFTIEDIEENFSLIMRKEVKFEYIQNEENYEYAFRIMETGKTINKYNFDKLREVVMKQNIIYEPFTSPDPYTNKIIQHQIDVLTRKRNKNKKTSFESIVALVSIERQMKDDEILDYTYYRVMKDYYMIERKQANIYNAIFMSQGAKECKIQSFNEEIDMYHNPYDDIFDKKVNSEEVANSLGENNKNKK